VADPLPTFDELVGELRVRLGRADALEPSRIHSFRVLMEDRSHEIADGWYWDAFEELEAQGHLDPSSHKANRGDACGRLSADGRFYLRASSDDDS
jgi:hypothetical protein